MLISPIAICVWILDVLIKGSPSAICWKPKRHLVESLLSPLKKPPPEYLYLNQREREREKINETKDTEYTKKKERKRKYEAVAVKSDQLGRRRKSRG